MRKLSSYQKLKQEGEEKIRKLTEDIMILVEGKDYAKVSKVRTIWKIKLDTERAV